MAKKIKYAYCKTCKNEVEKRSRKQLTMIQKTIWIMVIVATIGIAAIAYAFYLSNRQKDYCPDCRAKLEYSEKPFEKPKKRADMTPREKVLDKAGIEEKAEKKKQASKKRKEKKKDEEEKEAKKIFCSFCGEELDEDYPTCPFCQSARK